MYNYVLESEVEDGIYIYTRYSMNIHGVITEMETRSSNSFSGPYQLITSMDDVIETDRILLFVHILRLLIVNDVVKAPDELQFMAGRIADALYSKPDRIELPCELVNAVVAELQNKYKFQG